MKPSTEEMLYHYQDWVQHVQWITELLLLVQWDLSRRIMTHDRSKIMAPEERDIYAKVVPKFAKTTFGTEEHRAVGRELRPAWKHHLHHNRHHPEHFSLGIDGMTLIDLVEMMCDWKAAGLRKADEASLENSVNILKERHGIGPQLEQILKNTAKDLDLLYDNLIGKLEWSQRGLYGEDNP